MKAGSLQFVSTYFEIITEAIVDSEEQDIIGLLKNFYIYNISDDNNKQPKLIRKTFTKSKNLQD